MAIHRTLLPKSPHQSQRETTNVKTIRFKCMRDQDFPGGPVVKNPPSNAGEASSIPGRGTKIPHVARQLSPRAITAKPACLKY